MAAINPTTREGPAKTFIVEWVLGAGDTGVPIDYPGAADRTVQIIGNFGGATVEMQGTLEQTPVTWLPVTDAQGNAISKTEASLEAITELVRWIRPIVTGGTGTAVTILLLMRTTI